MRRYLGKTVLVTGGATGIGRATALAFGVSSQVGVGENPPWNE